MNIEIIPFTIDAYDEVLALWKQCEGVGLSSADSHENISAYLQRNPDTSFLARAENRLVGTVLGGHDGRRGFLWHLAVHPQFRRLGIGRRLVEKSLRELEQSGIEKAVVIVFNENRDGIAFWERMGWTLGNDVCMIAKWLGC